MRVIVAVPRRADNGRRDHVWRWLQQRWAQLHSDWPVLEGHHDDGPFNRSAAINTAVAQGDDWDVVVIADGDTFVDANQLRSAVDLAADSGQITFAFTAYRYLTQDMSDRVMEGFNGNWMAGVEFSLTGTCSQMVVVSRSLWDAVGGFDEGFVGWGMEDVAASLSMQAIGGGMRRVDGDVWHLYHPPSTENNQKSPLFTANVERMERYRECNYDPDKMRALLIELGVRSD